MRVLVRHNPSSGPAGHLLPQGEKEWSWNDMATFQFELVSPERVLFSGPVEQVVVPGSEGEFTVLPGHAPFMTTLKPGIALVVESQGHAKRIVVVGGFADVNEKGLTLLAEGANPMEEVTAETIAQEIVHAETLRVVAKDDEARRLADEQISRLTELKGVIEKS